jgi:ADP-L-glycero-D-manno-heptose 6-epimerase
MNKKVFVTGATGFIGHHLCNKLYEDGYRVFAAGRKDENKIKCHEFHTCNLRNIPWDDLPKIDICFHLAANNDTLCKKESEIMDINYHASINLFKKLSERGCSKFVYSSSCSVYGNQPTPFNEDSTSLEGLNHYAKSKIAFEKFAKEFSFRSKAVCVGLRYTNVYGTNESHKKHRSSMVSQIIQRIHKNERPVLFKDGNQERDWVYVNDVVDANLLASKYDQTDIFNIGSGKVASFNSLVSLVNKKMNKTIFPEYIECNFKESYQSNTAVSIDKARSKLRYSPNYSIEDGIQDMKIKLRNLFY